MTKTEAALAAEVFVIAGRENNYGIHIVYLRQMNSHPVEIFYRNFYSLF